MRINPRHRRMLLWNNKWCVIYNISMYMCEHHSLRLALVGFANPRDLSLQLPSEANIMGVHCAYCCNPSRCQVKGTGCSQAPSNSILHINGTSQAGGVWGQAAHKSDEERKALEVMAAQPSALIPQSFVSRHDSCTGSLRDTAPTNADAGSYGAPLSQRQPTDSPDLAIFQPHLQAPLPAPAAPLHAAPPLPPAAPNVDDLLGELLGGSSTAVPAAIFQSQPGVNSNACSGIRHDAAQAPLSNPMAALVATPPCAHTESLPSASGTHAHAGPAANAGGQQGQGSAPSLPALGQLGAPMGSPAAAAAAARVPSSQPQPAAQAVEQQGQGHAAGAGAGAGSVAVAHRSTPEAIASTSSAAGGPAPSSSAEGVLPSSSLLPAASTSSAAAGPAGAAAGVGVDGRHPHAPLQLAAASASSDGGDEDDDDEDSLLDVSGLMGVAVAAPAQPLLQPHVPSTHLGPGALHALPLLPQVQPPQQLQAVAAMASLPDAGAGVAGRSTHSGSGDEADGEAQAAGGAGAGAGRQAADVAPHDALLAGALAQEQSLLAGRHGVHACMHGDEDVMQSPCMGHRLACSTHTTFLLACLRACMRMRATYAQQRCSLSLSQG